MKVIRVIECKCGQVEEMPVDEQRWHSQTFDYIKAVKDEAEYKCLCGNVITSKTIKENGG